MSDPLSPANPATGRAAPVNREIELTLHVDAGALDRIARHYGFRPGTAPDGDGGLDREQHTTYFDTPDLALFRNGVALRVRRESGQFTQTLKTVNAATVADSAGVAVRQEWDWRISQDQPVLALLDGDGVGVLIGREHRDRLEPVFHTRIRRRSRVVHPDMTTSVEIALDQGETVVGATELPIAEIELELKEGRVAHLFGLALAIHAITPVRIAGESKAEQGFRLALDKPPMAVAPTSHSLSPLSTVAEAFRYHIRQAIRLMLANQGCVLRNSDPAGLAAVSHALRRIDSAMRIFRPVLPLRQPRDLQNRLKEIRRVVDHALTWDCLDTALESEPEGLRRSLRQEALPAMEAARTVLTEPRHTETILRLAFWLEEGSWIGDGDEATRKLLDQPLGGIATGWLLAQYQQVHKAAKKLDQRKSRRRLYRRLTRLADARALMAGVVPPGTTLPLNEQIAATLAEMLEVTTLADQMADLLRQVPLPQDRPSRRAVSGLERRFARDGRRARKAVPALWQLAHRPQA